MSNTKQHPQTETCRQFDFTELKEHIDTIGPRSVVIYIRELTAYVAAKAMIDTKYTKDSIDSEQKKELYDAIIGLNKLGKIFDKMDWDHITHLICERP